MGELRLGGKKLKVPALCGSVSGENSALMREGMVRAIELGADLIELRVDGMRDLAGWEKLLRADPPIILTNRPKREGGGFGAAEDKRVGLLLQGVAHGISCVDIELSTPEPFRRRVISRARESGVSVLMSYHDHLKTPPVERLMGIAKRLVEIDCDIAKVVTFARSDRDALRVLEFLGRVREEIKLPLIAFAMGEAGKITRIAAPLFGSPIVYAAVGEATAPGQLGLKTVKRLMRELGFK